MRKQKKNGRRKTNKLSGGLIPPFEFFCPLQSVLSPISSFLSSVPPSSSPPLSPLAISCFCVSPQTKVLL